MELVVGVLIVGAIAFVVWSIIKKACAFAGIAALLVVAAVVAYVLLR